MREVAMTHFLRSNLIWIILSEPFTRNWDGDQRRLRHAPIRRAFGTKLIISCLSFGEDLLVDYSLLLILNLCQPLVGSIDVLVYLLRE